MNKESFLKYFTYERPDICKRCGGKCCQKSACDCVPEDFNNDVSKMEEALKSGKYCIDFTHKNADSYVISPFGITLDIEKVCSNEREALFIRPKNQNRPTVDLIHEFDDSHHEGPCIFWSKEKGCNLEDTNRPFGGRILIPDENFECYCGIPYYKTILISLWKPYTRDLFELAKKYFPKDWYLYQKLNFKL